jgi:hypothetical protein
LTVNGAKKRRMSEKTDSNHKNGREKAQFSRSFVSPYLEIDQIFPYKGLENISSKFETVRNASTLFQGRNLNPYQCDLMSESIINLRKPIRQLCNSLNKGILPQWQSLLMLLYFAEEQSNSLPEKLESFRLICLEHSQETFELQQMIRGALEELVNTGKMIEEEYSRFKGN